MEINRYTYKDVYYDEDEQDKADKLKINLEKQGYILQTRDDCGKIGKIGHDYCDQYIKWFGFTKP